MPRPLYRRLAFAGIVLGLVGMPAPAGAHDLEAEVAAARAQFIDNDPSLAGFFDAAHAYALFPRVKKGAFGIGAARGKGLVVRAGAVVGRSTLSQVTVGLQLGGKVYSEVIFFANAAAFEDFTGGDFGLSAQASAIAASSGAAADADYRGGLAIFTLGQGGLMVEASVGGQKFSYDPL